MKVAIDHLVERLDGLAPSTALVLGSGLGGFVDKVEDAVRISYADLPGFPRSGVSGHAGEVVAGRLGGAPVLMLSGRAHYYEHGDAAAMRPALETLAGIGITRLLLTNAAGSVDPAMGPGSVMLITDHINLTALSPVTGARFIDLTDLYSSRLRTLAHAVAPELGEAVYVQLTGPHYETPAEVRMLRGLGGDLVGMSTALEAIAAREAGLEVLGLSLITNLGAGLQSGALSHQEVLEAGKSAEATLGPLLARVIRAIAADS